MPERGTGTTVAFVEGQEVGAYTSFVDTEGLPAAVTRELVVSGGFLNEHASTQDPKAFVYAFADNAFPYIPLLQPRLNTIEEWTFINGNNDEHPMHIHVNDFQVSEYYAPNENPPVHTFYQPWGQDNANLPSPIGGEHPRPEDRARLSVRTEFQEYSGTYVVHCHRLNHEDNGLMAIINVIPEITSFAVASPGSPGTEATVRIYDGSNDALLAERVPFPVPATLVDREADRRVQEFARRLMSQQVDPRQANIDWGAFREAQRESAVEALKGAMVLDELARRESIEVTDEDMEAELARYAEGTGRTAAAIRARLAQDGELPRLTAGLRRDKTMAWALGRARIVSI